MEMGDSGVQLVRQNMEEAAKIIGCEVQIFRSFPNLLREVVIRGERVGLKRVTVLPLERRGEVNRHEVHLTREKYFKTIFATLIIESQEGKGAWVSEVIGTTKTIMGSLFQWVTW